MIIKECNIKTVIQKLKKEKKRIVSTNGCFDIIHIGHLNYLKKSKQLGDVLIIALNSDSSIKQIKGPNRPINDQEARAEMLNSLKFVDYVVVFDEKTPNNILRKIKPNTHTKGGDYKKNQLPETKIVEKYGGKVIILPLLNGKSTSSIIKKILDDKQ